jgi:hypothetical protein
MKVSSGIELGVECLMKEMLGSLIAADVGLSVQEPLFVFLDPEFCASGCGLAVVTTSHCQRLRNREASKHLFGEIDGAHGKFTD